MSSAMTATHTPGPWTITEHIITKHVWRKDVTTAYRNVVTSTGLIIADTEEIGEANAHLIAASPELLNMVKKLARQIRMLTEQFGDHWVEDNQIMIETEVLIAKAEGR